MNLCSALTVFVLTTAFAPSPPQDKTLRIWTARALATVLAEVGSEFERTAGFRLDVTSDLPPAFERRLSAGERVDVVITGSAVLDEWIAKGRIVPGTRTDLARSGIGVGVRQGARLPDIGSTEAFTRALLNAKSIAYLKVGSGLQVDTIVERLGIADAIRAKVRRPDTDIVSELVSKGEVELGIVVTTQILTTPGVALAGPLPPELQSYHTFTAGVSAQSTVAGPALDLIRFLSGPVARRVMERQGMDPATPGGR